MNTIKECDVVSVRKVSGVGKLKAYADIRIGGAVVIKSCTVFDGKNGLFASLPRNAGQDGKWRPVVIASDEEILSSYQKAILEAYESEVSEA